MEHQNHLLSVDCAITEQCAVNEKPDSNLGYLKGEEIMNWSYRCHPWQKREPLMSNNNDDSKLM
ncbi:hypothetical protein Fmac_032529 [Flemingia macrophylla]|uniref:Uncharacterized protein n=1 Tax=Flemingia macrophylla TaxID=520843 RepID=A0ABD1L5L7_9FABA